MWSIWVKHLLPPQCKGALPDYNRETLVKLQDKFDELEGILDKPENVGITVEYFNLSFLLSKPSGGSRLVISFGEVGKCCKSAPSLMANMDNILRDIGK